MTALSYTWPLKTAFLTFFFNLDVTVLSYYKYRISKNDISSDFLSKMWQFCQTIKIWPLKRFFTLDVTTLSNYKYMTLENDLSNDFLPYTWQPCPKVVRVCCGVLSTTWSVSCIAINICITTKDRLSFQYNGEFTAKII